MDPFLSVILPVHNAEAVVANRINDLLEVVSEITSHFELLVIDDASTDQTEEIVHDLLPSYPQLRVLRLDSRQSGDSAMHAGFGRVRGEVVILCEDDAPISAYEIHRLWELRDNDELIVARTEPAANTGRPHHAQVAAHNKNAELRNRSRGIQMVRRAAIQRLDPPESTDVFFPWTTAFSGQKTNRHIRQ